MTNSQAVISFLLTATYAGVVGAAGASVLLEVIRRFGFTKTDMIRAVGSIFTRSLESSFLFGMFVNFARGIVFGAIYTVILGSLFETTPAMVAAGLFLGFLHGFVVTFVLVVTVAEHHPVEKFRRVGFDVAAAYFVAHLLFGLLVGLVVGASGFRL